MVDLVGGVACPVCRVKIRWDDIKVNRSFECPHCNARLEVPSYFPLAQVAISVAFSVEIPFALGARGWIWTALAAGLFYPLGMVVSTVTRWVIPPKLRDANATDRG